MHVAIAIVSYRSVADVQACLAALDRSVHRDFEVVVCENGGPAAYEALTQALADRPTVFPVRIVLAASNLGYAGGVNRCVGETPDADAWWVLNPDTEPHPECLAAMVARLSQGCDAVGCTVQLGDGRVQSHGGLWRHQMARAVSLGYGTPAGARANRAEIEGRQNYINGAAMLVGRRYVERVGLMREDYFLYCEEVEWGLRGVAAGMRLGFAPEAAVLHHHGASTGNTTALRSRSHLAVYLDERNKILVTRDRFSAWLLPAAAASLCLLVLRFGRARAWSQLRQAALGWLAGLKNERGPPKHLMTPST